MFMRAFHQMDEGLMYVGENGEWTDTQSTRGDTDSLTFTHTFLVAEVKQLLQLLALQAELSVPEGTARRQDYLSQTLSLPNKG